MNLCNLNLVTSASLFVRLKEKEGKGTGQQEKRER